jgi:hypothetical protein
VILLSISWKIGTYCGDDEGRWPFSFFVCRGVLRMDMTTDWKNGVLRPRPEP